MDVRQADQYGLLQGGSSKRHVNTQLDMMPVKRIASYQKGSDSQSEYRNGNRKAVTFCNIVEVREYYEEDDATLYIWPELTLFLGDKVKMPETSENVPECETDTSEVKHRPIRKYVKENISNEGVFLWP